MTEGQTADFRSGYRVILRWSRSGIALVLPDGCGGEVLFDTVPVPIPRAPGNIAGLVSVQGRPLAVLDLFDPWSPKSPNTTSRVVVIRAGADMIAIRTDASPGFATVMRQHDAGVDTHVPDSLASSCGSSVELDGEHGHGLLWDPMLWAHRRAATLLPTPSETEPQSGNPHEAVHKYS